MILEIS